MQLVNELHNVDGKYGYVQMYGYCYIWLSSLEDILE